MEHQQKKEMAHVKPLVSVLDPKSMQNKINSFLNDLSIKLMIIVNINNVNLISLGYINSNVAYGSSQVFFGRKRKSEYWNKIAMEESYP